MNQLPAADSYASYSTSTPSAGSPVHAPSAPISIAPPNSSEDHPTPGPSSTSSSGPGAAPGPANSNSDSTRALKNPLSTPGQPHLLRDTPTGGMHFTPGPTSRALDPIGGTDEESEERQADTKNGTPEKGQASSHSAAIQLSPDTVLLAGADAAAADGHAGAADFRTFMPVVEAAHAAARGPQVRAAGNENYGDAGADADAGADEPAVFIPVVDTPPAAGGWSGAEPQPDASPAAGSGGRSDSGAETGAPVPGAGPAAGAKSAEDIAVLQRATFLMVLLLSE